MVGLFEAYLRVLTYAKLSLHTVLKIGFESISYSVEEGEGTLGFKIVPKNNHQFARPIDFTVTDLEGEALSEFS